MKEPTIEQSLRGLIVDTVRSEVRKVLAEELRPDQFLTPKHAAELAEVTPETILRWVKKGKLTRFGVKGDKKRTRVVRVSRLELERLLKGEGARNDELSPEQLAEKKFG